MVYELLQSGNCPICKEKIKHETKEYVSYKSRYIKIYKLEGKVEAKCHICKRLIVDKR